MHKPDPDEANADRLRLAVRRAPVLSAVCSAPRRGVLPSLLSGGLGRLQRGCGEFVGVVLSRLGVLPFVSPGIVDLRVRGFDVRVVTPDSRARGSS